MTADNRDDMLRKRFQRLRAEEARSAPDFETMLARAEAEPRGQSGQRPDDPERALDPQATDVPRDDGGRVLPISGARRSRLRVTLAAGTLAAAALAGILLLQPDAGDREFEALVTAYASDAGLWRSPTDDLLSVPGMELLNTVPTVGWPYGAPSEEAPRGDRTPESDVMG